MKHLNRFIVASLLILFIGSVNAQDANNPWAISVGANAIDFFPTDGDVNPVPAGAERGNLFEEFFNVNDHWNIVPSVSYLRVSRYIGDGFVVGVAGSLNSIDQIGDRVPRSDLQYYSAEADVAYSLKDVIKSKWVDPYVTVGAGYAWLESELSGNSLGFGNANGGVGIRFWFSENVNIDFKSQYKHTFEDEFEGARLFQHVAALGIAFGGKDTDGDGIFDKDDACPEVPGLEEFNGCPDSDGDGIEDSKDACPNVAGVAEFDGCADTDGDGIPDPKDACPTVAGIAALGGCPDADGDGIKDADDGCPNEAGPRANNGCPYQDKDGDGVLDKDDKCPDEVGTVANDGCPEVPQVSVEVINDLNLQFKSVLFDYNKASIRAESYGTLDNVANIMKEYTNTTFLIEGHTDDRGRDSYNLNLSDERAASVRAYLTGKGISSSRLQSKGFGEARPIASNKTADGRQENRRVELSILSQ